MPAGTAVWRFSEAPREQGSGPLATLVITITVLAAGQVTYENALALAIGANVGTTITAILGSLSANVEGKRLAGAHLIFNVITGTSSIGMSKPFAASVDARHSARPKRTPKTRPLFRASQCVDIIADKFPVESAGAVTSLSSQYLKRR